MPRFLSLLIALACLALPIRGGVQQAPPVTAVGYFVTQPQPTPYNQGMTFMTGPLPAGYNCTSVTIRLHDWQWKRTYQVAEVGGQAPGGVIFSAGSSRVSLCLTGPDGVVYHNTRTPLVPYAVFLNPGTQYQPLPYADQWTGSQQIPALAPIEVTLPVTTPSFCEGAPPAGLSGHQWHVMLDTSKVFTQYVSGDVRTRQTFWIGGTYDITFNRADAP